MLIKIIFIISLFGNFWIWKIFSENLWVFILIVFSTFALLWYYHKKNRLTKSFVIVLFIILVFLQAQTTQINSLTKLSNDDIRVFDQRVNLYNSDFHLIRILFHKLKLANFLEGDFHTITFRVQRNLFEAIDPNIYFFGGHPRERLWVNEFEKFPYFFIIPFGFGLYLLFSKKDWIIFSLGISSLLIFSLVGHQNKIGPFLLFPMLVLTIYLGMLKLLALTKIIK